MRSFGVVRHLELVALALIGGTVWAQMPPPPGGRMPPPDKRGMTDRLTDAHQRLDRIRAADVTSQRALDYARVYLNEADQALKGDRVFASSRLLEASDALRTIALIRERLHQGGSLDHDGDHRSLSGPPHHGDMPPPAASLQWVYFRVQQADFFYDQSRDPHAKAFPKWARDFYQLAVREMDRQDPVAAEANAHCANEVVRALENLAQASAPMPPPPVPSQGVPNKPEPAPGAAASLYSRTENLLA